MRAKLPAVLMMIGAASPLCAQAGNGTAFDKFDPWYFGRADRVKLADVARIRAVDAHLHRVSEVTMVPAPPSTAAPEMSSRLAATGLTLLLGGVSVLRSRRPRSNF